MSPIDVLYWSSYFALVVSTWDLGLGFNDELNYIWRLPIHIDFARLLYLVSRYFALLSHIIGIVWTYFLRSKGPRYPVQVCRRLMMYQSLSCQVMLGNIDLILMLRVYALWNCDWRIGTFLLAIILGKTTLTIVGLFLFLPYQDFTETCLLGDAQPGSLIGILLPEFLIPLIMVCMTNTKKILIEWRPQRPRMRKIDLLSHVNQDCWMAMCVISVAIAVGAAFSVCVKDIGDMTQAVFPIIIVTLSSTGCRLIFKIRDLAQSDSFEFGRSNSFELTQFRPSLGGTNTTPSQLSPNERDQVFSGAGESSRKGEVNINV